MTAQSQNIVSVTISKGEIERALERNFFDGKNGEEEDPHSLQAVRTTFLPRKKKNLL
jgi:hypothetical protein